MPADVRRAVWLLGLCQCVLWGVLYYSFSVLLVPVARTLALPHVLVAGAFSAGLLAMAMLAPAVGRWLDAGHALRVTRIGLALSIAGLVALGSAQGATALFIAWLAIGVAMAMLLYEPAFALIVRSIAEAGDRLRALAAVTVMGGLASSIFLPVLSGIIDGWGWRAAALVCALGVALTARVMEKAVIPALPPRRHRQLRNSGGRRGWPRCLRSLMAIFASGTLASMALTTLLIPLLIDKGVSMSAAACVLAALGVAQLPGRIWMLRGTRALPDHALRIWPIVFQVAGLVVVPVASSLWLAAAGVALFGLGAGLQTLARPWLVQSLYGADEAGRWNGEIARVQGFARALGPVVVAGIATVIGTPAVLFGAAVLLAAMVPLAARLPVHAPVPATGTCRPVGGA